MMEVRNYGERGQAFGVKFCLLTKFRLEKKTVDGGGSKLRRKAAGGWGEEFCLLTKLHLQNRIHQLTKKAVGFLGALHEDFRKKSLSKICMRGPKRQVHC